MKKLALIIIALCIGLSSFAQLGTYTFAYSTNTYTPLSGGTALIPPNTSISGNGWFEQCYNVPLPFVFFYNGTGFSSCFINSNGHLSFGKATATTNVRPHLVNNGQSGAIIGYGCASTFSYASGAGSILLGGLMDFTNANPITYGTIGTAPNRIFIVQWTNAYRTLTYYGSAPPSSGTDALSFQIRLKEGSNVVEMMYNASATSFSSVNAVVGLSGATTTDFNLVGGTSWTSVTNNSATTATNIPYNATTSIPAGVTYTFTPPAGLQPSACSGAPTSPTVLATTGITNSTTTLSLSGLSRVTGLTYQWQSSSTGVAGSFNDISGATDFTYVATPTAATYYLCQVACGGGTKVASTSIGIGYESAFPAIPSYTYTIMGGYPNGCIGNFQIAGTSCGTTFNDVGNSLSAFNYPVYGGTAGTQYNYLDYTVNVPRVKLLGSTSTTTSYTASVNNNATNAGSYCVWIDINDNGSFADAGEFLGSVTGVAGVATNFTLTIPANAFGIHRMRIRGAFSAAYGAAIPPTGAISYFGQAIDYIAEITPPAPTATSNSPVCVNGVLALTSSAVTGATYTWSGPLSYLSTTTSTTQNYTVASTGASGTYSLYTTVDGANACAPGTTSVTVNPQPSLTGTSNGGPICAGNSLSLSANGAANVTGYSWSGPATISSATSASASVASAPASATGTYTVAVNNGTGSGCTVNYTTAAVVNALPDVTSFGTTAADPCIGNGAVVTVSSSSLGSGTYTVNYNISGANTFTGNTATLTFSGGTGTFTSVGLPTAGSTTVTINSITSGITGCTSNTGAGNTFAFTVNSLPSPISGTAVVCAGLTTTLTDVGGGTWASNNTSIATVGPTSGVVTGVSGGVTAISYTLSTGCTITTPLTVNQTPAITGVAGTCVSNTTTLGNPTPGGIWNSSNTSVATISGTGLVTGISLGTAVVSYTLLTTGCSATQVVTITNAPTPFTVTGGGNYCVGGTPPHVGLSNSTTGIGYQLYLNGSPVGGPVSGIGGPLDFGTMAGTGTYTVVGNPGSSCAANMTGSVTITTLPLPTPYLISGGGNYCAGTGGVHIYLNTTNVGISYQLMNGPAPSGLPMAGTSGVIDFGFITAAGIYTVFATNTITGCTNTMTGSVTVSVNPLPTAFTVSGGGGYCVGGAGVAVNMLNSTSGFSYQLYRGGVSIGTPVVSTGGPFSFGSQTLAGTYTVVATNPATGCVNNMTGSVNVIVNPLPTIFTVTGGGAYCTGAAVPHIGINGSSVGVNYQMSSGGLPFGPIYAGTGVAIDFGAFGTAGTYTVLATNPTSTCTNGMLGAATVSLNPPPTPYTVTGGGSYCAGTGGLVIGLSGSDIGTNYYLYNGASMVGGASGTGTAVDFGLQTLAGTYTVIATVASTGCNGNMVGTAIITINGLPTAFIVNGGGNYCSGSTPPNVTLSSSTTGVSYQLFNGVTPVGVPAAGGAGSINFGPQSAPGIYKVIATNGTTGCVNTMTGAVTVGINPLPSGYAVTGGGSYCSGGAGVHVGINSSDVGISYQLKLSGVSTGPLVAGTGAAIDFGFKTAAGDYTITATNNTTLCVANMPGLVTVTVLPLPNIYAVTGGGTYCAGGSGMPVGLFGSESGVNYQLFRGAIPVGPSVGGSGSALDFGIQTLSGTYTVVATNATTGCVSTMSGSAVIGTTALPAVFNVTGGGNYCSGSLIGLHVGLSGSVSGINYQLYYGGTPTGAPVAGTGFPLDFGVFAITGAYTVIASDPASTCTSLMNGTVSIGVNALPATHNVIGGGGYFCAGGTGVSVGLDGSNAGVSYQLYRSGLLSGAPLAGTGAVIDFGIQTVAGPYTVVATEVATGCTSNMTGGVVVSVSGLPPLHLITGGGNYCPGGTGLPIGLNGSDPGIYYQLYRDGVTVGGPVTGTGFSLTFGLQSSPGLYTIRATNTTTGCNTVMAGTATIAVAALPVVFNVTGGGGYCAGTSGAHVYLSGSNPGNNYALYSGGLPVGTVMVGTGSPIDFGAVTAGIYNVVATNMVTGCNNNMNGAATIVLNPLPTAFAVTGGGVYCVGANGVHLTLGGSQTGINYQLFVGGTMSGAAVAGTGSTLDFGLRTAVGNYTVVATNTLTGCNANMTGFVTVATNPLPFAFTLTGGGSYCSGTGGVDLMLSGSTSGVVYQLYNGGTPASVPLFGTGSALDFGLQTLPGTYTVIATDASTSCESNMVGSSTITELPLPVAFTVGGGGVMCAGTSGVNITLSNSQVGMTYQLYNTGVATGTPIAGTGSALDFGPQTTAGAYTVVATNPLSGCTNFMTGTANINASALPIAYTVSSSSTTGYCVGGPGVTIFLSNSELSVNYQLYRGTTAVGLPVLGSGGSVSFGPQTALGSYNVVATNVTTGCTNNMTGSAIVSVNPLPTVFTVTGGGGYCSGSTSGSHIYLSGSSTSAKYQLYQSGLPIGPLVNGTGAALDMGAMTLASTYLVVAINNTTGCTANMIGSATVSVIAGPAAYTVTGGGNFCTGASGVHVGLLSSNTGSSYQLYKSGVVSGAPMPGTGSPLDFGLKTASGLYTVMATNNATGCTANMTGGAAVNAIALPAPQTVTGGGSYCAGGTGVNVGLAASTAGIVYRLYNGSTLVGTPVTGGGLSVDFGLQTSTGVYTVIGMDASSTCLSNMTGSAVVSINALPDIYPLTGGGNYCAGGTGVHVGLASSTSGVDYTLYNGSMLGTIAGTGTLLDFGLQTAAGSYSIVATNTSTGCNRYMAGTSTIGINPVVVPSVNISTGSGDTVCSGTLTTFTATGTNGGTSPSVAWRINGVPTATTPTYNYIPANGDIVEVLYTSSEACAVPAVATDFATITVLDKQLPVVAVSANPGIQVCQGTAVIFTATSAYGGSLPSYLWLKAGVVMSAGSTYSYVPADGDAIVCKLTSNYSCRLATTVSSTPVNMIVDVPGTPVVSIAAYPNLNIVSGETLNLVATVTNGGPSPTFSWRVNGVTVPSATLPTFSGNHFEDGDVITCNILSSGGCSGIPGSNSVTVHVNTVGVHNVNSLSSDLSIAPNPTNGSFVITGTIGSGNSEITVDVTNMLGQVVYSNKFTAINNRINEQVNLGADVANGMYLLNLHSGTENKVFRLVVKQ